MARTYRLSDDLIEQIEKEINERTKDWFDRQGSKSLLDFLFNKEEGEKHSIFEGFLKHRIGCLFALDVTPISEESFLSHARKLFVYHAGQRLTSIRYFFVVVALFMTSYVGVVENSGDLAHPDYIIFLICLAAIAFSLLFLCLDLRNGTLVRVDEDALVALESRFAQSLGDSRFLINENARRSKIQYKWLRFPIFLLPALLFFLIMIVHFPKEWPF